MHMSKPESALTRGFLCYSITSIFVIGAQVYRQVRGKTMRRRPYNRGKAEVKEAQSVQQQALI